MSSRTRRITFLLIVIIAIAAGLLIWWLWSRKKPAVGTNLSCEQVQQRLAQLDPNSGEAQFLRELSVCQKQDLPAASSLIEFNDLGVHFSYPSEYEERQPTGTQQDDRRIFITRGPNTRRLTVMRQTFTDPLEEFSAVRARRLKPEVYQENSWRLGGHTIFEFTNEQAPFEKLLVFQNETFVTTIAVTAVVPMGAEQAAEDYQQILDSLVVN